MSPLEEKLLLQLTAAGFPAPVLQHKFASELGRQWRFDLCFPEDMFAVEVEGGNWKQGAHGSGQGAENDAMKQAVALLLGWKVIRVNNHMIEDGRALWLIDQFVGPVREANAAGKLSGWKCKKCDLSGRTRRQKQRQKARESAGGSA